MRDRHGWTVGRYVIMPDHIHFFAKPVPVSSKPLNSAMAKWKEWTAKRILNLLKLPAPLWQPEFFDHILRSDKSRSKKWIYMHNNPVRAGLVTNAQEWPFSGKIDFD